MWADKSAMCAINRHLRVLGRLFMCIIAPAWGDDACHSAMYSTGRNEFIDSNLFVQEFVRGSPKGGCNGAHPLVILSVSEGSHTLGNEILR